MLKIIEITSVLAGSSFNVPIFRQNWLVDNQVLAEEDFSGEDYFTPVAVNVRNDNFTFLVVPERIQLQIVNNFDNAQQKVQQVVGEISKLLPHCPVVGMGLNFTFFITAQNTDSFVEKCRSLFVCEGNPAIGYFSNDDARFGAYYSVDAFDSRIRLDIKPIKLVDQGDEDCLRLSFNAHRNISSMTSVQPMLDQWNDIYGFVNEIAEKLNNHIVD